MWVSIHVLAHNSGEAHIMDYLLHCLMSEGSLGMLVIVFACMMCTHRYKAR